MSLLVLRVVEYRQGIQRVGIAREVVEWQGADSRLRQGRVVMMVGGQAARVVGSRVAIQVCHMVEL